MNSLISSFATLFLFSVSLPTQYIHMRLHPIGSAIWSDIVRDIRGLHTVHNTLHRMTIFMIHHDYHDFTNWYGVFCVFLWWFCSLGTRLGMPLAHTLWVSLFCVSQIFLVPLHPPLILFDQYKKSKRTFFLLCPRMIDTLKQKMTHIMCLNLNKMSNTSIFLITEYFLGASEEKNWIRKIRSKWMMRKKSRERESV